MRFLSAHFEMIADIVKERGEVGRGDVFHYFPGGDEVELYGLAIEGHLKWFGDVTGEEVDVVGREAGADFAQTSLHTSTIPIDSAS